MHSFGIAAPNTFEIAAPKQPTVMSMLSLSSNIAVVQVHVLWGLLLSS